MHCLNRGFTISTHCDISIASVTHLQHEPPDIRPPIYKGSPASFSNASHYKRCMKPVHSNHIYMVFIERWSLYRGQRTQTSTVEPLNVDSLKSGHFIHYITSEIRTPLIRTLSIGPNGSTVIFIERCSLYRGQNQ